MTQIGESIAAAFGFGEPPGPGSLEVTVVEKKSGKPVAGVKVALRGPTTASAVTGADGRARFPALEPGAYWTDASQEEFEIEFGKGAVVVDPGEPARLSLHIRRIMLTLVVKRIQRGNREVTDPATGVTREVKLYGHWWIEIDETESYGWWPAHNPTTLETLTGVPGQLNGMRGLRGTATTDAHHGHPADETFHPAVVSGKSAAAIKSCIRTFAGKYKGSWSWPIGQNCHSFQEEMMEHCGLEKSDRKAVP